MDCKKVSPNFKRHLTQRAPDVWESARFQALFLALGWFRQKSFTSARPAAGNASRWVASFDSKVEGK
jgi:hypothetical protein